MRCSVSESTAAVASSKISIEGNNPTRYLGKGVLNAVNSINNDIKKALLNKNVFDQKDIDYTLIKLDGTDNKSRLGANAILGVSIACAKAAANALKIPLYQYIGDENSNLMPLPMMNILNGGAHASNNVDIQEFMIAPVSAKTFKEGLQMCVEVFHTLKNVLKENNTPATGVGDEGGYAPNLKSDEEALVMIVKAIKKAGYEPFKDFKIAIDAATSEWYNPKTGYYDLPKANITMTKQDLVDMWKRLVGNYPIYSIEDGMGEDDLEGWSLLTKSLGSKIQLVGDDLFVTNKERLEIGITKGIANAILIKVNQIGTLTETLETIQKAKDNDYKIIISHRSGETDDTTIADLSVATNAGQIKTGAPSRMDRVAKYNQLLRIEEQIAKKNFE